MVLRQSPIAGRAVADALARTSVASVGRSVSPPRTGRRSTRRHRGLLTRLLVVALTLVLVSACGARVSDRQVQSLQASEPGTASATGPAATGVDGVGDQGPQRGDSSSPGGPSGGSSPTDGSTSAVSTSVGSPTAPGGNGGATDVGVTADEVVLGNVSTLSGPVPGLFQGAVVGAQAVIAYQNSIGGIHGRTIRMDVRDDHFDSGSNRAQTVELLAETFALLGSASLYDDAAADQIESAGVPDASFALSEARRALPNNFSVAPVTPGAAPTGPFLWWKERFPGAVGAVASIYADIPSARSLHLSYQAAAESVGYRWVYSRAFQATETSFTADVIRMRQSGVRMVFLVAADERTTSRLAREMEQQDFTPEVFAGTYFPGIVELAGSAVEGMYSGSPYSLFGGEDAGIIPEVALMNEWIQRVSPGFKPNTFAATAWSEGRLLFQAMGAAGPGLTRDGVIAALRQIDDFSADGLLAPAGPASKRPPICFVMSQVQDGVWTRIDPREGYRCDGELHRP